MQKPMVLKVSLETLRLGVQITNHEQNFSFLLSGSLVLS